MTGKSIVFAFGRFNPPTIGHQKVFDTVLKVAQLHHADHIVFTSQSNDVVKNPLKWKEKVSFLKRMFPKNKISQDESIKSIWQAVVYLASLGYRDLYFIGGDDRAGVAGNIQKYIGHPDESKRLDIDSFQVVDLSRSSGSAAGVSGTLARKTVVTDNRTEFDRIIPGNKQVKDELWNLLRSKMKTLLEEFFPEDTNKQTNKPLNKPFRIPSSENSSKKFRVYVKNPSSGNIVKVDFGDANMEIKRDDPGRRKNFLARHNCSEKTDKTKPGYWSCKWGWGEKSVSKKLSESKSINTKAMKKNITESIDSIDAQPFNSTTGALDGTYAVDDGSRAYYNLQNPGVLNDINVYLKSFNKHTFLDPAYPISIIRNKLMTIGAHFAFNGFSGNTPPSKITFPVVSLSNPLDGTDWEKHASNAPGSSSKADAYLTVVIQRLGTGGYRVNPNISWGDISSEPSIPNE